MTSDDGRPATEHFRIREARPADCPQIAALVRELAAYEREPDAATAGPEDFERAFFAPDPRVSCLVAEVVAADGSTDGELAGLAVWYVTFSTWQGRHGMWLEDLFVRPQHRRLGIGRALFAELGRRCAEQGWGRLEWWVLDWNAPAHAFYQEIGGVAQDGWTTWRLDGAALAELGSTHTTATNPS
ncbi:ribosomal protein S18 acetylase RimI-like enzyme [Kineococcus xinjiangensis]|uniref:Ribosomal protein S18 acetylase RimI-like enzyme n=1 Tax=Kineococcus xinjiangensis TaxID=512762 RepID=A0A2S6ICT1_9ACTN|nr:GNAT family N-acetyltransferase [Kineococcus xinjiangensis]PPK92025.1 ribosomal protein S18 acetylase RimI-like enzyme [Kineococcus xinjiangensis]